MKKKKLDSAIKSRNDIGVSRNDILREADERLAAVGLCEKEVINIEACIEEEIGKIRERYAGDLAALKELKFDSEKALKKFALKNKEDLFGPDGDKVSLDHGIILYTKEDKVTIPKDAVERIEELGWKEGIKIVKNIDRPVIEKWTDEKLAAIGASKKPKESITWELSKDRK